MIEKSVDGERGMLASCAQRPGMKYQRAATAHLRDMSNLITARSLVACECDSCKTDERICTRGDLSWYATQVN